MKALTAYSSQCLGCARISAYGQTLGAQLEQAKVDGCNDL